ncbi:YkgJ family cysteine cluster protein [Rhizobium sp. PAMB 3174]
MLRLGRGVRRLMSEQRFRCTACGLCCHGLLPLTVAEALSGAGRFPLAISITPVKTTAPGYQKVGEIAATIDITRKKTMPILVTPVSFVPPHLPCPELDPEGLCSIHTTKPLRCRTMPFYPYRDEAHQADMLKPRAGWLCETGEDAPVVYRDRQIVDRTDFDAERDALVDQTPALRRYADLLLKHAPAHHARVLKAAQSPAPGRVIVSFVSYLRYDNRLDLLDFSALQLPVLEAWAEKTAADPKAAEHHRYYREAMAELGRYRR